MVLTDLELNEIIILTKNLIFTLTLLLVFMNKSNNNKIFLKIMIID